MKKSFVVSALALAMSFGAVSCKKKVDTVALQNQATEMVAGNPNASVTVDQNGVAHLQGTFSSAEERDAAISQLKGINGIKDVMDMTTVAEPVQTASAVDPAVQQRVQDAVKDYPGVKVEVVNNELTLTGNATPEQARKIKESVDALKVGKVNYNYEVK
ncbi:BON domain-containing protein [Cruoricaptor ignavus]|uniref:BON domain-containing protein n=1 Tax=Cruoricaptor ignavus TaxID=1118202 RepID=UPI00370D6050